MLALVLVIDLGMAIALRVILGIRSAARDME
jgi:hypothetical protein